MEETAMKRFIKVTSEKFFVEAGGMLNRLEGEQSFADEERILIRLEVMADLIRFAKSCDNDNSTPHP